MDVMTIYYSKSSGNIRRTEIGEHDMSLYGDAQSDISLIYDHMVTILNYDIINNPKSYTVDVESKMINRIISESTQKEFAELKDVQQALLETQESIIETLNGAIGELTLFVMGMFEMYHPSEPVPETTPDGEV